MYGYFLAATLGLVLVAFLVLRKRSSGGGLLPQLLNLAKDKPDPAALAALLDPLPPRQVRSALDELISQLWEDYRREEAVPFVVELQRRAPASKEARYQVQRLAEVEPQLAIQAFGLEGLKEILGIREVAPKAPQADDDEGAHPDDGSRELEEGEDLSLPDELKEEGR